MRLEQHLQQGAGDQSGAEQSSELAPAPRPARAKLGSTPRKVNETRLKCNELMLCCTMRGLAALLLIAGVCPRYSQWSTELHHSSEAGQGSLALKEAENAICGQALPWLLSLTALGTTHTFSYLINPFPRCHSQRQQIATPH